MTVHRGKVHEYLGMDLDFSSAKVFKIGMIKYIKKILEEFPKVIKSAAATPAAEHLFDVREDNKDTILPETQMLVPWEGSCPRYLRGHQIDALQQA